MVRNIVLFTGAAILGLAQQPTITNAELRQASAANGLATALRTAVANSKGPSWVGYAVPTVRSEGSSCCYSDSARGCGLEGQVRWSGTTSKPVPVQLEGSSHVVVLLRFEQGEARKLRVVSMDCPLDAGGLSFTWLSDVRPPESLEVLETWAKRQLESGTRKNGVDAAVHAISRHLGPEADAALMRFADPSRDEATRKAALFWLGNSRGRKGFEVVSRVAREDASDKVREHAIFVLTQTREPEAVPTIIRIAKEDKVAHVRGQALFWLSQKASKDSAEAINDAVDRDPETEVKKKAVFALSQLPKDEGIPRLIQVARTHPNAAVRKQAMFWLGQSRDARALAFFEQVLSR